MSTTSPVFALPAPQLTDGANIETAVTPLRDRLEIVLQQLAGVPIGGILPYAFAADPTPIGSIVFLLADGRLIDKTTYAAFFAGAGHAYNGGVDPGGNMVRIPDKRGRASVGADSFGTALGAAGRLTRNAARGSAGGEQDHVISATEIAPHQHTFTTGSEDHDLNHSHAMHGIIAEFAAGSTFASISVANGAGGGGTNVPASFPAAWTADSTTDGVSSGMGAHHHGGTVDSGGGPGGGAPAAAHNNMQPHQTDYCIVRVA